MGPIKNILLLAIPAALLLGGAAYFYANQQKPVEPNYLADYANFQKRSGPPLTLAERYQDANGDLVADTPTDASKLLKPETIIFSGLGQNTPERGKEIWGSLMEFLAKELGKPVEYYAYPDETATPDKLLAALKEGKVHVTVMNTGLVPTAVNNSGYVPLVVPAKPDGTFAYQMEILVAADSEIKDAAGLKGKQLTLSNAASNAGFKAPIFLLHSQAGLAFGSDYSFNISGNYNRSIEGLAAKKLTAIAVPSDYFERFLARNDQYSRGQFKTIMKSEDFPPLCVGTVYNLDPSLADKLKGALEKFPWQGTSIEKEYGPAGQSQFVPVSYKSSWALVRTIDEGLVNLAVRDQ